MAKREVTNDEIMTALSQFATSVDERFEGIDKQFEGVNRRFKSIDQRFDSQEKFNLVLMKRLDETDARITTIEETMASKDDIRRIEITLDGYAAKIDTYAAEMAVMQHKIDRLERMILYLADKAHIPRDTLETV